MMLKAGSCAFWGSLFALSSGLFSATHFISDQLPHGVTLADYGLGARPEGADLTAVRLVELATLPGEGQVQQIVARDKSLFVALKEGRIWEYDLDGDREVAAFLDVAALRPLFNDYSGYSPSRGLRGFAFHPDYAGNGLVYTMHKEDPDAADPPEYGTNYFESEYVLAEWNFNQLVDGEPSYRQLFRIRFEHLWHTAQQLGFDSAGHLYACFGDNGARTGGVSYTSQLREVSDVSDVGQDFDTIQAGVIRIDPLDPSLKTDSELLGMGLKRSENGSFSIPLGNPFVGVSNHKEELYSKGFRNPLSLSFSPMGLPVVADVGEQTMEEINVLMPGGNYGWPNREGTFLVPWCDQINGAPLGADESMVWMPSGAVDDPAVTYHVRDRDQTNLRLETLARSAVHDDGFQYPVFQFSHEGNNSSGTLNGTAAIIGGDFYEGFWCEELEGRYLFGNISTDQIFYGQASALDSGVENDEVRELSLIDANGNAIDLATIIGNSRVNMRFGKDSYGNLYLASKTNGKLYRFQGTPELGFTPAAPPIVVDGTQSYFEFTLIRPQLDGSIAYTLEMTEDLMVDFEPVPSQDYEILETEPLSDGRECVTYRYLQPVHSEIPRFFRFDWE